MIMVQNAIMLLDLKFESSCYSVLYPLSNQPSPLGHQIVKFCGSRVLQYRTTACSSPEWSSR